VFKTVKLQFVIMLPTQWQVCDVCG